MAEKYFLALFNEETWNEFLESGSSVYGTNINNKSRMEKTNPGDFLICYVTRLSRFIGLLEITSKAYLDEHHIWKNDTYPSRVNVHLVYNLEVAKGIPVSSLKTELTMFKKLKNPKIWSGFFISPLNRFEERDAKIIVDRLKEAYNN